MKGGKPAKLSIGAVERVAVTQTAVAYPSNQHARIILYTAPKKKVGRTVTGSVKAGCDVM